MKKFLLASITLGLLLAGCSKDEAAQTKQKAEALAKDAMEKTKDVANAAAEKTAQAATTAKDAIADKLSAWKLTPADLKDDFEKSGRIVRSKGETIGQKVGETIDDARIVTIVKAKFVAEKDLSAFAISVSADKGVVTLSGSAKSLDLIGRAVALALNTDGVSSVVSVLRIAP